jgi:nitrilase
LTGRYALAAWGTQVHVASTWDRGEPWMSTMRHVAKEGRSVVIGCCQAMRKDSIPDDLSFKSKYLSAIEGWINPGGSVIVDPDGKIIAGPVSELETILYADVRQEQLVGPRRQLDIAGHYARPDVFELIVHRRPTPVFRKLDTSTASEPQHLGDVGGDQPPNKRLQPAKARKKKMGASKRSRSRLRG